MGQLSKDERSLLEKLQAKLDAPDEPDVDIEVWAGDKGARGPLSKLGPWLARELGIDLTGGQDAEDGDGGQGDGEDQGDGKGKGPRLKVAKAGESRSPVQRRFAGGR